MRWFLIMIFCLAMFFPWFEKLEHTYQSSLWTYSDMSRGKASNDWQFRIGGETESTEWTRLRLGLPARYATIDAQWSAGIVQVRIEPSDLLGNLIPVAIIGLVIAGVKRLWKGPKAQPGPRPTKT